MYIALDEHDNRICIEEAEKGRDYFCPVCHSPMIVKDGTFNAKHFAHKAERCNDSWDYDMSEWHKKMQSYFPENQREVVVTKGNRTHIADVLVDNTVIEFQHSPLSVDEFADRNNFFISLGYRIVWVIDLDEQYKSENLYFPSYDNPYLMRWNYPYKYLSWGDIPSEYNKKFSLWLSFGNDSDNNIISRVVWSTQDEDCNPTYQRLIISEYMIDLDKPFDIEEFFMTKEVYAQRAIKQLNSKYKYKIKYSGVHGKSMESYTCPLSDEFGLNIYGNVGCIHCSHCYMIIRKKRKNKTTQTAVYCCYPEEVSDVYDEKIQHYSSVDIYDI